MSPNGHSPELDPAILELVRRHAWRLIGHDAFQVQDQPDVQQELLLRLLRRLSAFNPERGSFPDFCGLVLHNSAANLLRDRRARSRRRRRSPEFEGFSDQDQLELALDVEAVLARLPVRERAFAERRMAGYTMTGIAKELKVPRTTLYGWQDRLRRRFEQAGLDGC